MPRPRWPLGRAGAHLPLPQPCFAGVGAALAGAKGTISLTSAIPGLGCHESKLKYLIPPLCLSPLGRFPDLSHCCAGTKPAQLVGKRPFAAAHREPWLYLSPRSIGASVLLGKKQAGGLGMGWLHLQVLASGEGSLENGCVAACWETLPAAKGPLWAFSHRHFLLSQAAASKRYCERKATNVISPLCPAQVSAGAFPIPVHAWFAAFWSWPLG